MTPLQRKITFFWLVALFIIGIGKAILDPYDLQDVLLGVAGGIVSLTFLRNYYSLTRKDWAIILLFFGLFFAVWDIQNPTIIGQHEWHIGALRVMEAKLGGSLTDPDVVNPLPSQGYQIGVSLAVIISVVLTGAIWIQERFKVIRNATFVSR